MLNQPIEDALGGFEDTPPAPECQPNHQSRKAERMLFKKKGAVYELANSKFAVYAGWGEWWSKEGDCKWSEPESLNRYCLFDTKEEAIELAKSLNIKPIQKVWPCS